MMKMKVYMCLPPTIQEKTRTVSLLAVGQLLIGFISKMTAVSDSNTVRLFGRLVVFNGQ